LGHRTDTRRNRTFRWPDLLTRLLARAGRAIVGFLFRLDLGNITNVRVGDADSQVLAQWIRNIAQNLNLLVAWGVVWLAAHFSMIGVGLLILGPHSKAGAPLSILIPVEVLPGFFAALNGARIGISITMTYRMIPAVGDARGASRPPPAWTQKRGPLLRLSTPSDWDFLPALAVVIALEVALR
jgi:hypothetical protein